MDPETIYAMGNGIYRALMTMIQTIILVTGLAWVLFLVACFASALLGDLSGKDRPARIPAQSVDRRFVGSPASIRRALEVEGEKG
jgi:hypothetical protein